MKCAEADTFIHAFVDGELAGVDRDSYEQHLLECDACAHACRLQGRFKAAVRGHLARPPLPAGLRMRIEDALAASPPIRRRWVWQTYPRLAPAAAAAVVLIAVLGAARRHGSPIVLEQALRTYHAALPMDVVDSNCSSIVNWFRGKVDFTVPPPRNARACQGGRLVNVQDHFGAYFVYQVPSGHRVALMVFNADDETLDGPRRRVLADRDVYFGSGRGASTAAYRDRDGLYYVLTSDLDEDSLSNLVEAALHDRQPETFPQAPDTFPQRPEAFPTAAHQ
jgi:anti-sigma factor RsiW